MNHTTADEQARMKSDLWWVQRAIESTTKNSVQSISKAELSATVSATKAKPSKQKH
jgi:hypothetical protein